MAISLTNEKKGFIFKMLAHKPFYETGIEFGFDKHYRDANSIKGAMYRIYTQVRAEPSKYGVSQETVDLVVDIVSKRSTANYLPTLREQNDAKENIDIKELVLSGRQKAMILVHRKLEMIGKSKKKLNETNLGTLATVAAILFDKGQIIKGEATENVAVLGKIDTNMSPDQALDMVLKMRELNQAEKERIKK